MKKIIGLALCLLVGWSSNAQDLENSKENNKQLAFGVLGNSGLFVYKYDFDKKFSKRIRVGGFYLKKGSDADFLPLGLKNLSESTQYELNLGYGLQKNLKIINKLDFYYGIDFIAGISGSKNVDGWEMVDSVLHSKGHHSYYNISNGDYQRTELVRGRGNSIGFNPVLGLNYKIHERLLLGVEYNIGLFNVIYFTAGSGIRQEKSQQIEEKHEFKTDGYLSYSSSLYGRTAVTLTYCF